jgi:hypothetical protein
MTEPSTWLDEMFEELTDSLRKVEESFEKVKNNQKEV